MGFIVYNPNPTGRSVGDCLIRAVTKFLDKSWNEAYIDMAIQGLRDKDMPSSNAVLGSYLRRRGYDKVVVPDGCPDCYTLRDFCEDHPNGKYLVATSGHVVTVVDGNYYDTWDSGSEVPIYYWKRGEV